MTDTEKMITGWSIVAAVLLLIVLHRVIKKHRREKAIAERRNYLFEKFGDMEVVEKIMAGRVWQGMSQDCLIESWGHPADIDEKVYKTKIKETWKYGETGPKSVRTTSLC
jgi:hypothetical protein